MAGRQAFSTLFNAIMNVSVIRASVCDFIDVILSSPAKLRCCCSRNRRKKKNEEKGEK